MSKYNENEWQRIRDAERDRQKHRFWWRLIDNSQQRDLSKESYHQSAVVNKSK